MHSHKAMLLATVFLFFCGTIEARTLLPAEVPEPLQPWTAWVMHGEDQRACPFIFNNINDRRCALAASLSIRLDDRAGSFRAQWRVYTPSWIHLPGDKKHWPQDVTIDGKAALVVARGNRPALELSAGKYLVEGRFNWDQLPEIFPIPPDSGIVDVQLNGQAIDFPDISEHGQLWLKQRDTGNQRGGKTDSLVARVFRRIVDEVPQQSLTQLDLEVAGEAREVTFDGALLANFIPISISSPIPARLEPDGRLRVQVRPGRWSIQIRARSEDSIALLKAPSQTENWPDSEVWVFDARNHLRLVEVNDVQSVDPRQTNLPKKWRQLPAFRLAGGDTMSFDVIRRGDPEPEPDKLNLTRDLWLDFDGSGYTVKDVVTGSMTHGWRLDAGEKLQLGRVLLNNEPQFITTQNGSANRGVEVRRGAIHLTADSRWTGDIYELPALGWDHDFQSLTATLNLPPGWRLFSAAGIDQVNPTWVQRWTLLDLFLVLIIAAAIGRLLGPKVGVIAALTLILMWHEPGAPKMIWLHILATMALLRVLPAGKLRFMIKSYRNASLLVLVVIAIPFLISQIRVGLYPQLEKPSHIAAGSGTFADNAREYSQNLAVQDMPAMAAASVDEEMVFAESFQAEPAAPREPTLSSIRGAAVAKGRVLSKQSSAANVSRSKYKLTKIDPLANVQTGPGVPRWNWNTVQMRWNGPVERDQTMSLWLLSPRVNLILHLLRVGLLAWLALVLLRALRIDEPESAPGEESNSNGLNSSAATAALLAFVLASFMPQDAAAEFPTQQMLQELKQRLSEPPSCLPVCAQISRLAIEVEPSSLTLRLEVVAAEDVAIPLPAHVQHWLPTTVAVDGQIAEGLYRTTRNELWLKVRQGRRQVLMSGPLPARKNLDLPLPLRPRYVSVEARGWTVEGIREDGQADKQLQFKRSEDANAAAINLSELEPAPLPPFVRVERTLRLGLGWRVITTVTQLSSGGAAVVIAVPLLPGESVTTPNIHVVDNAVQVNMSSHDRKRVWESALKKAAVIELSAPTTTAWTEVWRADVSPIWHAVPAGIAVVHHQNSNGQWLPEWRPWPGEKVSLTVTRPVGVEGQTLTIDQSRLHLRPGKRASDVDLVTTLRTSQGGQHTVTLPELARLQSVTINGIAQPIRQQAREVTLPLNPGSQEIALSWRGPEGISWKLRTPLVDLAIPSVNSNIQVSLANGDRWVLFTSGPTLGPAVLFWGSLIAILLVAAGLGRVELTPLNSGAWVLLAIGLSQVNIWLAATVVVWLFALGLRARFDQHTRKSVFNLTQIGLVLLTVASLVILFQAIEHGLLGRPDMQIAGNGSSATNLHWYQDHSDGLLPQALVISVPLMAYRLLMLVWALWLAFALLRWLRWAWTCFSTDGLWRGFRFFKRRGAPEPG